MMPRAVSGTIAALSAGPSPSQDPSADLRQLPVKETSQAFIYIQIHILASDL